MKKIAVIGAGVGGLAAAIRLANSGFEVTVFEANDNVGGKINKLQLGAYRFDMGPSIFTAPNYIKELYDLCGADFNEFKFKKLETTFNYFFTDGTRLHIKPNRAAQVKEFQEKLDEDPQVINEYLDKCAKNYKSIAPLFIEKSLHKLKDLLSKDLIQALSRLPKYKLHQTMDEENRKTFKHPKTQQIFNRFATYNGSDPYQAPAMLNMIQHLEMNEGIYLPKHGMVQIAQCLYQLALNQGVKFRFNEKVLEIKVQNKNVSGIKTTRAKYDADAVFSNMDVAYTYEKLLPKIPRPKKILSQEKSSSALVFYWGINESFNDLSVHNMLFSDHYKAEFDAIFKTKKIPDEPSIYIHITGKELKNDAPKGKENWFVMINVPINNGQNWKQLQKTAKTKIIDRINKTLNTNIAPLIEEEFIMDPIFIEKTYFGKAGSIYGNASNNKFAAFYRHPNFSKKIKGLYFVGVTVHPGGGIPLALNSAKIAVKHFKAQKH